MPLTEEQVELYSRHIVIPQIGEEGQEKILKAKVVCVGAGGLGSPASFYLIAAGIGKLGIVEPDIVEFNNLQRQILHTTNDLGRSKADSALEKLHALNPKAKLVAHSVQLTSANALEILSDYDIVIDCTDNYPTRYLLSDACVLLNKPCIHGSIFRFEGQVTVFIPHQGPCYRCLYPIPPSSELVPSPRESGIFSTAPGVIGVIQTTEALKLILGVGNSLKGRLLCYNALNMSFKEFEVVRNIACPACGDSPTITELVDYEEFCAV